MNAPYVQFFDDPTPAEHDLLGGKCASLATMTAAGMPVPPGFAVTTAAYDAFVRDSGMANQISTMLTGLDPADVAAVEEVARRIREMLLELPVPVPVHGAVEGAYAALIERIGADVPVAVRSSATAEDLPDASFAGQQDTYLWLRGWDQVREHIRRCWASIYTSRAILYRLKNDIPDEGLSMAVAVQKMVNARAAGVAITLNPTTGDRSKVAIDASYGVGEMVVSGQVTPDNLLLDKVMLTVVEQHCGAKHAELVPDADAGGLVEREVEEERRGRLCLESEEFVAIARLAKRAEKHYGCPQDIEWAFDRDLPEGEDLLLLQARPETIHSAAGRPGGGVGAPSTSGSTPAAGGFMSGLTSHLTGA
ncbi:PEP/pyruvate-binding domain-containing protein [Nocardioides sp. NPDC057767]|uniref:PEP/pyruvate-binding domain-containing protein n=1 Tax=unclassified Nocardioides TaxID=2615069 RepID=UPI00366E8AF5